MTEDLQELSKKVPGVVIAMEGDGEDGDQWCEYFRDGKTYTATRPDWTPPPFDETQLQG